MSAAPPEIVDLVARFREHRDDYLRGDYNETQLRQDYLDPFFVALGWDVHNRQGHAEAYRDVILEQSLRVEATVRAPDYCFRIGGTRKFFVEAKKPSVDIALEPAPAFQLRRYAWTAKLPLSILTNFDALAVYDCRVKPDKSDRASTARILLVGYGQYVDRWDEIAAIFSHEAILKGAFDKYAESTKKKRGTAEVDDAFLEEIEGWRKSLAENLALRNKQLSPRELNTSVQRIIDRIVFLRMCEGRGIETFGRLQAIANGKTVYPRLVELFHRADEKYNSGLFHFQHERGREKPDELTPGLAIDDRVLKDIIARLYYPDSPYEFAVLPADILGQVYEQFLGKVIRLTAGHRAKVEEKPEVRKAGGVYYTPTYIVDYIVENTLGKLLEGKTPQEVGGLTADFKASKSGRPLTVLDPACGSGSFLIVAYQCLLDWYLKQYTELDDPQSHARGARPRVYQFKNGDWRLTTTERKRILLAHIYGVDIDYQAVEVTKLSLLLKVLEGETQDSLQRQLKLIHKERALPDLANNIKCGNSLIGPDFYATSDAANVDEEERLRINVFDWNGKDGFRDIMKSGGFDAVIGNPPYGFHQIHTTHIKPYLRSHYASSLGSFEHYFLFYERALRLLRNGGRHGFIVPVTWLTIPSARALRGFILNHYFVERIVWLPALVFRDAQVNTLLSIISNVTPGATAIEVHSSLGFQETPSEFRTIQQSHFVLSDYYIGIFEGSHDSAILKKIDAASAPLKTFARPCSGYNPYEVGKGVKPNGGPHSKETVKSKPYHSQVQKDESWKPEIVGRDLARYAVHFTGKRWIRYGPWLAAARDPQNFRGKRILVQEIVGGRDRRLIAAFVDYELYYSRDVIPIKIERDSPHPFYLLGIVNSRLITWYHHRRNPKAKKGLFPKVLVSDLSRLPIARLDSANKHSAKAHDRVVQLVQQMLDLHERLAKVKTEHERTALQRQIDATDSQIDQLVYELYGLSDDEIRLVEESTAKKGPR
jgi:type I restriction-modification system DNA methylase subunit